MPTSQGTPCWYELGTTDLDAAGSFYSSVLGWEVVDSGMEGYEYRLAQIDGTMVAGMMSTANQEGSPPPNWVIYFTVEDLNRMAAAAASSGGEIYVPPTPIPGTGRFTILADPQGAVFGMLEPEAMDGGEPENRAFAAGREGHGSWHELMTTDPAAAFDWYSSLFGWSKGAATDMGDMGVYQHFAHEGADIGGMMGQGDSPVPCWLPYFGVGETSAAIERIGSAGGTVIHGPAEVAGGVTIVVAIDPQGAVFAVVGAQ